MSGTDADTARLAARSVRLPVGDVLASRGVITERQLRSALAEQVAENSRLGRILLSRGYCSRLDLWSALAEQWQLDHVDLISDPPDRTLLERVDPDELLEDLWVPLSVTDGTGGTLVATVAICDEPDRDRADRLAHRLGVDRVRFVATTDWDIEQAVLAGCGDELVRRASYELAERRPDLSAADPVAPWQKVAGLLVPGVVLLGIVLDWRLTLLVALLVLNVMFTVGVAFKIVTSVVGMFRVRGRQSGGPPPTVEDVDRERVGPGADIPNDELPVYTILVPAYGESNVVHEVVEHVTALDYPLSKLQVLLLLEADDTETVLAAKASRPPDFVRLVVVPPGGPQTKPKACNVGLAMAEGEFLVIYDAEDRPEPGQLREAVAAFRDAPGSTVCFQARLNYFNARTNILTRMFTLEYSFWFDDMLPGLDALGLPVPLGGTSNHFRTRSLRELGGWDPFNVTEDADLGVRAAALDLHVGITDSTTWEEACSEWRAWIRQRTRWIKGYIVTAMVQTRNPCTACRRLGARGLAGLIGLIAGTPALFLAAPLVWGFWLYTFLGGVVPDFALPSWALTATFLTLVVGNGAMIVLTGLAAVRRRAWDLMPFALLNPLYWVLHSIAAWRALYQVVVKPSHWEKTPHGIVHGPHAPQVTADRR
jgi:cellulose synthase/poly-beta-1,6-N-acetylglucosamine synthase-like glycosyltransferase